MKKVLRYISSIFITIMTFVFYTLGVFGFNWLHDNNYLTDMAINFISPAGIVTIIAVYFMTIHMVWDL